MRIALIVFVLMTNVASLYAGEFNKKLAVGDVAPSWIDLPGTDGRKHSLEDWKDAPVLVLAFICNSCPVAVDYEARLIALAKKYDKQAIVVAVNVNTIEADRMPKMQERAKDKKYPFVYLYDETQKIARDHGATYTPEFFVFDSHRRIVYMGAMDDKSPPAQPTRRFLEDAIEAALAGTKPAVSETLARGCMIRVNRVRR